MGLRTLRFIRRHPIGRRHPVRALGRWLSWQAWSRTVGRPLAIRFAGDARLLVAPGMTGATGNLYVGLHEFEDMAFVVHALRPGDRFADVGANVGSYTILAAAVAGANGDSFEPVPSTFEHLRANVALNEVSDRVRLHQAGVGREPGMLRFSRDADTMNHVVMDTGTPAVEVPVVRLDDVLDGPLVVKMDVEGWETEALAGADRLLSTDGPLALVVELLGAGANYGFDEDELHRRLVDAGFEPFSYAPFERRLDRIEERRPSGNTLYLRRPEVFAERVRTAPPFRVFGRPI